MKTKAVRNREALREIQRKYVTGEINRQRAKIEAQPVLERINLDIVKATDRLNKKYHLHRKPPLLTFASAMRNEY